MSILDTSDAVREREYVAEWRRVAARDDDILFDRRLAWDDISADGAARALGERVRDATRAGAGLDWQGVLHAAYGSEARAFGTAIEASAGNRVIDANHPIPFEEILIPLVAHARRAVAGAALPAQIDDAALCSLERALLERLAQIAARTLYVAFAASRALMSHGGGAALSGVLSPATDSERGLYRAFVAEMAAGRIWRFFHEYPVLGRLCGTATALWIDSTCEFLARLAEDRAELDVAFGAGPDQPLGYVTQLDTGLSDSHEGGRAVVVAHFASGRRVVYKPRRLDLEVHFREVLAWLNGLGTTLDLRTPAVLSRPTHGWLEFIQVAPCTDAAEVERYYRRTGMLLAVAYTLNGGDFHYENLLAAGEHPILIDLEMLLTHRFALVAELPGQEFGAAEAARHAFETSVLKVALLPGLKVGNDGETFEVGGLAAVADDVGTIRVTMLAFPNTDVMRQIRVPYRAPVSSRTSLARLNDVSLDGSRYVAEIVAGFQEVYRLLATHGHLLIARGGLVDRMRRAEVRFIFRQTNLYASLIERLLHPNYMRDETTRAIELDVLTRPLLTLDERPTLWPIVAAERTALQQMDIPFFAAPIEARSLVLPNGDRVTDCFVASAFEEAVDRIGRLSNADLAAQTALIRASFDACAARGVSRVAASPVPHRPAAEGRTLPRMELGGAVIEEAIRAAERLHAAAVPSNASALAWLGPVYVPRARRYRVGPLPFTLFDGYGGIAIFLAALGSTVDPRFGEMALEALAELRTGRDDIERFLRHHARPDVCSGLAGGIYALVRVAKLLGDRAPLADARSLVELIDDQVIARDQSLGVMSGTAGALFTLLALHTATRDDMVLARAVSCGDMLLTRRAADDDTDLRVWATRPQSPGKPARPEIGYAHGLAGIAAALQRLGRRTARSDYLDAAAEAIAHERIMIAAAARSTDVDSRTSSWGCGSTGIALARLAGGVLDADVRAEIEVALADGRALLIDGSDDICTGASGHIDLLLGAAEALNRPALLGEAQDIAARIVTRARVAGDYRTAGTLGSAELGFFRGTAGIMYEMLRTLAPARLTSVLTWD